MLSANAAFLLTSPLVKEGLDLVHHFLVVKATGDVQVHVPVADMAVTHAADDIIA